MSAYNVLMLGGLPGTISTTTLCFKVRAGGGGESPKCIAPMAVASILECLFDVAGNDNVVMPEASCKVTPPDWSCTAGQGLYKSGEAEE